MINRTFLSAMALNIAVVATIASTARAVPIAPFETQDFENLPQAASAGWSTFRNTTGGNNFGLSAGTNFTGSASGSNEAGGKFERTGGLSYIADTTLGGAFTLDDSFSATGELEYRNSATNDNIVVIGFFNADQTTATNRGFDSIGFVIAEAANNAARADRFRFFAGGSDATNARELLNGPTEYAVDGDYRWTIDYNGATKTLAAALLSASLEILVTETFDFSSVPGSSRYNAFGIANGLLETRGDQGSQSADIYIDNVSYSVGSASSPVPEPASVCTFALGLAGVYLAAMRRRKSA